VLNNSDVQIQERESNGCDRVGPDHGMTAQLGPTNPLSVLA
jgi:hypothetical protein